MCLSLFCDLLELYNFLLEFSDLLLTACFFLLHMSEMETLFHGKLAGTELNYGDDARCQAAGTRDDTGDLAVR